ncbi:hypothetical protein PYCCODRAFT_1460785 [Trametes coccinea BRFM310]|uniref:Uncharacterized protein n=1 Tax=Trametes coccinea (strain BRFM310) TaxID=1353009 RepID=A0A1Y2IE51_TRAC3|nr:hypothetical protein PYCCODRAFT_1460785 [Trametes coccinea BRFM310]
MANLDVDETFLDNILDPLFSFLSSVLPPQVYTIVESLVSHSVALIAALFKFVLTLVNAESWDAQKILPPLITLLAAYLALVSFYRTTGWMIRTAFWFVKWGGIIGMLAAGAGYFMGNANANGENGVGNPLNGGLLSFFGNALLGMLNQDGQASQNSRSTRRSRTNAGGSGPRTRAQTRKQKEKEKARPKAWDSWDKHREWQYNAEAAGRDDAARMNEGVQEVVQKVVGIVQNAMGTGWWETVKNVVEGNGHVGAGSQGSADDSQSSRRSKRDTKEQGKAR